MDMRWALPTLALALAPAAHAEGYEDGLQDATLAAETLIVGKAHDWRRAPDIVKDRAGFMIFERNFPYKSGMTPDDMIACVDDLAFKAKPSRPVETMIAECGGVPGYVEAD